METGTVKSFDGHRDAAYGFIRADGTGAEIFFPLREAAGYSGFPKKGQRVTFVLGVDRTGRPIAKNVRAA
jgi:cold shock CspA family protein